MCPSTQPASSEAAGLLGLLEQRLQAGQLELPMLSHVAAQVMDLCEDEDCDPRKLAELVQRDVSLSGNVLRLTNSALYSAREPVVSVQQAIWRIGTATLRSVALASAVQSKVFDVPGHETRLQEVWRHCTLAGAWAREIARARRKNSEGAYLCGMLHDVGKPIVLQEAVATARAARLPLTGDAREHCMQVLHERVGARLIAHWKLPDWMAAACGNHHDCERQEAHREFARTAHAADLLAHWHADPARGAGADEVLRARSVFTDLGFYADELQALLEQADRVQSCAEALA
jgi:HD-like signal output (HDOD) protein